MPSASATRRCAYEPIGHFSLNPVPPTKSSPKSRYINGAQSLLGTTDGSFRLEQTIDKINIHADWERLLIGRPARLATGIAMLYWSLRRV
jgi:hypothetical protein